MNKKEGIKKIKRRMAFFSSEGDYDRGCRAGLDSALLIFRELDEPEKPVVPQFVADWYEDNKDDFEYNIYDLCVKSHEYELEGEIRNWFDSMDNKPIQTLVNMHQFGYEVKKEKLYTARLKIITKEKESYVYKIIESGEIYLSDLVFIEGKSQVYFTQKELEELKYWNNPNFEIEEVEE